jgi:hypothetical protein
MQLQAHEPGNVNWASRKRVAKNFGNFASI